MTLLDRQPLPSPHTVVCGSPRKLREPMGTGGYEPAPAGTIVKL